ncbi:CaiB/BaiF CoA transferase family protein [Chloroflexota bacterium]
MSRVLNGIRVLDFSRFGAGPMTGAIFSDMGAEVIRVEKPTGEDDRDVLPLIPSGKVGIMFVCFNRGKKSITLDIKSAKGSQLLKELIGKSDIVLHNFPPTSADAKLFNYEDLKKTNPSIILLAVSAYGQYGPYMGRSGFDPIGQAMSGAMAMNGFPGDPPLRAAVGWVDYSTALSTVIGGLLALDHRRRNKGQGQMVDTCLLDSASWIVAGMGAPAEAVLYDIPRPQIGNDAYLTFASAFKAKDGWVMVYPPLDPQFKRFARLIGRPELIDDPRFKERMQRWENREILREIVNKWVEDKTVNEIVSVLEANRIPTAPVLSTQQMVNDKHIRERRVLLDVESPYSDCKFPVPGIAINLSLTPGEVNGTAPRLGEHNMEVYGTLLNLKPDDIALLQKEAII